MKNDTGKEADTMKKILHSVNGCAWVCSKCGAEPRFTKINLIGFPGGANMADAVCPTPGCPGGSFRAKGVDIPGMTPGIKEVLEDPAVHNLTKDTLRAALDKDIVDAYFDVRMAAGSTQGADGAGAPGMNGKEAVMTPDQLEAINDSDALCSCGANPREAKDLVGWFVDTVLTQNGREAQVRCPECW